MAEGQKSWYQKGAAGEQRAEQIKEEQAAGYGPLRFYLKPGKSAKVTFLDSEGFFFFEHQLKINGNWNNFFTCTKDFSECPLCESGQRSSYVCAFTVIDHSEYINKDGKSFTNQKKLLVCKPSVLPKLARKREAAGGDLTFAVMDFHRDSADDPNTGQDIDLIRKIDRDTLAKLIPADCKEGVDEWLKPFDYMKLFEPKSVDLLRQVAGQPAPVGSEPRASAAPGGSTNDRSIDDLL